MEAATPEKEPTLREQAIEAYRQREVKKYEGIIGEFNDNDLKTLLQQEFIRAGVSGAQIEATVPFSDVTVKYESEDALGHYWPIPQGQIALYAKNIEHYVRSMMHHKLSSQYEELIESHNKQPSHETYTDLMMRKKQLDNMFNEQFDASQLQLGRKILTLGTLIHEEIHALSEGFSEYKEYTSTDSEVSNISTDRLGFRQYSYQRRESDDGVDYQEAHNRFSGLNEAFTEIIAKKIERQYVAQFPLEGISSTEALELVELFDGSYSKERWVAEQLTAIFSVVAEVPHDVVERSFFHAYLHKEDVLPQELVAALFEDIPSLDAKELNMLLLRLQIAIQEKEFRDGADIFRLFDEIIQLLPEKKQSTIKDEFSDIFEKYKRGLLLE